MIKPKGRPATQCAHCRESRKSKQLHTKCKCSAGVNGKHHASTCPCHVDKELCTCSKNKSNRRTSSNPPPSSRLSLTATTATPAATPNAMASVGPSRSSSSSSLASNSRRQRKSTIMNSRGPIIHPSSSASLSTKLSLMSSKNNLSDSNFDPSDDADLSPSLPMLFPFNGAAEDISKNGDLLNSLDSSSLQNYRSQLVFPSSSASSLSTMMQEQSSCGPESVSSLGNFMTSSSNVDGYSSDADPPLQLNYPHYQQSVRQKPMKVDTDISILSGYPSSGPSRAVNPPVHRGIGEIIVHPDDSILDDFTLLSPDDNYEVLTNGASALGLLDNVDKSDYSDSSLHSKNLLSHRSPTQLTSPSSIQTYNSEINLFQNHEQDQIYLQKQKHHYSATNSNHPLGPILTANRPPHKDVDYASHLAQSRANRRTSPSSTPSSSSPSSISINSSSNSTVIHNSAASVIPKQNSATSSLAASERSPSLFSNNLFTTTTTPEQFEQLQTDQPNLRIKDVYPSPFDDMRVDIIDSGTKAQQHESEEVLQQPHEQKPPKEFPLSSEFSPLFQHDDYYGFDSDFQSSSSYNTNRSPQVTTGITSPSDNNIFAPNQYITMDP